jgi:hypothetical protein
MNKLSIYPPGVRGGGSAREDVAHLVSAAMVQTFGSGGERSPLYVRLDGPFCQDRLGEGACAERDYNPRFPNLGCDDSP